MKTLQTLQDYFTALKKQADVRSSRHYHGELAEPIITFCLNSYLQLNESEGTNLNQSGLNKDEDKHATLLKTVLFSSGRLFPDSSLLMDKFINEVLKKSNPWKQLNTEEIQNLNLTLLKNNYIESFKTLLNDPNKPLQWENEISIAPFVNLLTQNENPKFLEMGLKMGVDVKKLNKKGMESLGDSKSLAQLELLLAQPDFSFILPELLIHWKNEKNVRNWKERFAVILPVLKTHYPKNWVEQFEPLITRVFQNFENQGSLWEALKLVSISEGIRWKWPQKQLAMPGYEKTPFELAYIHYLLKNQHSHFMYLDKYKSIGALFIPKEGDESLWITPKKEPMSYGVLPFILIISTQSFQESKSAHLQKRMRLLLGGNETRFWNDLDVMLDGMSEDKQWLKGIVLNDLNQFQNWEEMDGFKAFKPRVEQKVSQWIKENKDIILKSDKNNKQSIYLDIIKSQTKNIIIHIEDGRVPSMEETETLMHFFSEGWISPMPIEKLFNACNQNHLKLPWNEQMSELFDKGMKKVSKNKKPLFEALKLKQILNSPEQTPSHKNRL